jgi:hypothetical protein
VHSAREQAAKDPRGDFGSRHAVTPVVRRGRFGSGAGKLVQTARLVFWLRVAVRLFFSHLSLGLLTSESDSPLIRLMAVQIRVSRG